jgi:hypothetical protein
VGRQSLTVAWIASLPLPQRRNTPRSTPPNQIRTKQKPQSKGGSSIAQKNMRGKKEHSKLTLCSQIEPHQTIPIPSTPKATMSQVVYITTEPSQQTYVDKINQTQPDWIHPHLIETSDPVKGRQFRVSAPIPKNTRLLVDRAYSIIPVVDNPTTNNDLICSNPACNRRASCERRSTCPNTCVADVAWCGPPCREADSIRHGFECAWLKRYAAPIRAKYSEYDFGMLWIIVRLLASRHCQRARGTAYAGSGSGSKWKYGWEAIESLCGSEGTWPHDMVRSWTGFVKKYLLDGPLLPHGLSEEKVLHVICQEEANSFGLYPRETGQFPLPWPVVDRGVQYAGAVYPTASMANHSCLPNVCGYCSSRCVNWNCADL